MGDVAPEADGRHEAVTKALGAPYDEFFIFTLFTRFSRMWLETGDVEEQDIHANSVPARQSMSTFTLTCLGVGNVVATGIFTNMPRVFAYVSGPSVILPLLVAAFCAAIFGLVLSEFASDYRVTGGGFIYVLNTFGQYASVLAATSLIVDYVFGAAAVVRNFSYFFAEFVDRPVDSFKAHVDGFGPRLDYIGLVLFLLFTLAAAWSPVMFVGFNTLLQITHVLLMLVIIIAALSHAQASSWEPFFPSSLPSHGGRTVLLGASSLFFVFNGFDVIALGAEEVRDAATTRSVPLGIMLSILVPFLLYAPLTMGLVMLYPHASFVEDFARGSVDGLTLAFQQRGMDYMKFLVAPSACIGIFSSSAMNVYGLSRILTALARERMIPMCIGELNTTTKTPVVAVFIGGVVSGVLAFFSGFEKLADMTSIGTLSLMGLLSLAMLFRRYAPGHKPVRERHGGRHLKLPFKPDPFGAMLEDAGKCWLLLSYLFVICGSSIGFAVYWNESSHWEGLAVFAALWFAGTLALWRTLPLCYVPERWCIFPRCLPWVPSLGVLCSIVLIGGLGDKGTDPYERLAIAYAIGTGVYLLYGVHANYWYKVVREAPGEEAHLLPNRNVGDVEMDRIPREGMVHRAHFAEPGNMDV